MWWKEIKSLEGKTTKLPAENHLIDGEWMTKPEMVEALNKYFASVDGMRAGVQAKCANFPDSLMPISYGDVKTMIRN